MRYPTLSIQARIAYVFGILAVLSIAVGVLGLIAANKANDTALAIYGTLMPSSAIVAEVDLGVARQRLSIDRAVMTIGTPEAVERIEKAQERKVLNLKAMHRFIALAQTPGEAVLAKQFSEKLDAVENEIDHTATVIRSGDQRASLEAMRSLTQSYEAMNDVASRVKKLQHDQSLALYTASQARFALLRTVSLVLLIAGLLVALMCYFSLRRAILGPISTTLAHFSEISAGNLTTQIHVTREDEMGLILGGLAQMQHGLLGTVTSVRSASESISSAAQQIAAGNTDLSSRTEEQAAALEETAASMNELSDAVRRNTESAQQASTLAGSAVNTAEQARDVIVRVVDTMKEIDASSKQIAAITGLIDGIAFQTNILSLNAAVEAARAGEEGRGFAVVAGEVRALAQRSAAAAKEIRGLIDVSAGRVDSGSRLVGEAGSTMEEVTRSVKRVSDIMVEIASASAEQSQGILQVSQAVSQMDDVTQQNAALVEEASAAAQSLHDQSNRLIAEVARFKVQGELSTSSRFDTPSGASGHALAPQAAWV